MKHWTTLLLCLSLWLPAWADEGIGAGTLLLEDDQGRVQPALLRDVEVEVEVQGVIAHVVMRQQFTNAGTAWVQGLYQLPMPADARTDQVVLEYGDVRLVGEIREKRQAEAMHRQASREGRRSALVAWQRPGMFDVRAANIPPGETVTVEIAWVQPVPWVQGGFELRLPMTYTERYRPANLQEPVQAGGHLPAGLDENDLAMPQFSLRAHLQAGLPLARVVSLYHEVTVDGLSESEYHLQLSQGLEAANRDFVLRWEPERLDEPLAALYRQQRGDEQYWALLLVPQRAEKLPDMPREMIFVLDVSGSMQGTSLEQAREAMLEALLQMRPEDRLNIVAFSSGYTPLWPESRPASDDNLLEAARFIGRLQADGGTEMLPALRFALEAPKQAGLLRQVVFLTDGAVEAAGDLYRLVKARAGESRVFPVGIGAAPDSFFMKQMARLGRGSLVLIGDLGEVQARMGALFQQLRSPALRDVHIAWPALARGQPARVPDLYLDQPLWQVVKTEGPMPPLLQLQGMLGKRSWLRAVDTTGAVESPWLFKLWAGQYLEDRRMALDLGEVPEEQRPQMVEELTELALEAGLVSPWTSFVVTAEERVRPEQIALQDEQVGNARPAAAPMRRMQALALPQTDLELEGHLWLMLAGLLLLTLGWRRVA